MPFAVTFVNSPDSTYSENQNYGLEFMPTWVFTLAGYIPAEGHELAFFDTRFDEAETIPAADLFLFSGINQDYNSLKATWLTLKGKYPQAKSLIGGPI